MEGRSKQWRAMKHQEGSAAFVLYEIYWKSLVLVKVEDTVRRDIKPRAWEEQTPLPCKRCA